MLNSILCGLLYYTASIMLVIFRLSSLVWVISFLFLSKVFGQEPFDCNGRIYRVLEEQGGSTFQEVLIDLDAEEARFEELHFYTGLRINGIAYRPADNLIYGVLLEEPYVLCRIDANYQLERLRDLPLPSSMLFVSGDISPDERYLVLLGYSPEETGNLLALVDLAAPNYTTTIIPAARTNPNARVQCADIAFHPTLNQLFGFEHSERRLITIDIGTGLINNTSYPSVDIIRGNMPSIFFDAFGNLFGVGASEGTFSNRNLYRFNTEDGSAVLFESMGFERNQDGCSCPFKVELLNRVSSRQAYPCTELEFEFTLINRTDREQIGLVLRDTFPQGVIISQIDNLPFNGEIISGIGSRFLEIQNIDLPLGSFTFNFIIRIQDETPAISVFNQAFLNGIFLTSLTETEDILSDDPETILPDDPTFFAIDQLQVTFDFIEPVLCPNDTLLLASGVSGASNYEWNTGSTNPQITVTEPGNYSVTVTSDCAEAEGVILIRQEQVTLDLGEDLTIDRGEVVELFPTISSNAPIQFYFWEGSLAGSLSCQTCPTTEISPKEDAQFLLEIENEWGCHAMDALNVFVQDFQLYIPNAFSPNGDQHNDFFYLQSPSPYALSTFRVFDRWGNLLFEQKNIYTNDQNVGWNGMRKGKALGPGVFVWVAELQLTDGSTQLVSGDVTLLK